jgi:hypothetical protein
MALANLGRITSRGKFEDNGIVAAVALIISLQLGTETPRFHADDGVDARIVGGLAIEDLHSDEILFELAGFTLEGPIHGQAQKSDHAIGARE